MRWTVLACVVGCLFARATEAKTFSVVAFASEFGVVFLDSLHSKAAFQLFESLNVEVENRSTSETKIFAPLDGSFRIACTSQGSDVACAVMVYASEHAALDFDSDRVELTLPAEIARNYQGIFPDSTKGFHFETEDKHLTIDWSPTQFHILCPGKPGGQFNSHRLNPDDLTK